MKVYEVLYESENQRMDHILSQAKDSLYRIGTELDRFSEEKQYSMANMALNTIDTGIGTVIDKAVRTRPELSNAIQDVSWQVSKLTRDAKSKKPIDYIMAKAKELANMLGNMLDFGKSQPNSI